MSFFAVIAISALVPPCMSDAEYLHIWRGVDCRHETLHFIHPSSPSSGYLRAEGLFRTAQEAQSLILAQATGEYNAPGRRKVIALPTETIFVHRRYHSGKVALFAYITPDGNLVRSPYRGDLERALGGVAPQESPDATR